MRNLIIILAAVLMAVSMWADDFNTTRQKANQGDASAQISLGYMYEEGKGVTKDYTQAVYWYRKAAEQESARGQCNLGYMYENGKGVSQDYTQAVYWYRKAAEKGYARGQNNLGVMYKNGKGVAQDYAQAAYWYRKAAEQGYATAQNNLGLMYEEGKGVTTDYTQAVYWYRKSAEQGNDYALCNLGYMYEDGRGVTKDYTQAVYWYRKAADKGIARGQCNLGYMYENGKGVAQDYTQAAYWYRKAAEQGYARGQNNLGFMYKKGNGVAQDYTQAAYWYRKAAEQGYASAQNNLGLMYEEGKGVTKDYTQAVYWYRKSAEQGYDYAQCNLGYMYENGKGVAQDYSQAIYWYRKSADQGHERGVKNYQRLYALGYKEPQSASSIPVQPVTPQPAPVPVQPATPQPAPAPIAKTSLVDTNIPTNKIINENTFVVIIANEEYKNVAKVPYALNDGRIFAKYCQQTLGVPANHVKLCENATYNDMRLVMAWLKNVCDIYKGDASVIFYYTGHGIPDESDKSAYLLPVDGDGRYVATGYKMDDLYDKLGTMPAKSITVLLDACFSGASRDGKMVSQAKGVAIKAKKGIPQGNTVVLAAAQGDETAGFKEEEGHGMFTYYLLKKLQETSGNVTLQELSQYIIREVSRATVVDSKLQTPCVTPSALLGTEWQNWKLK